MLWQILVIVGGSIIAILIGIIVLIARTHKKVPQGSALIRTGFGGIKVAFDSGMFVIPVLHKMEKMNLTVFSFPIKCTLKSKDKQDLMVDAIYHIRPNKNEADIVEIAQTFGIAFTHDKTAVQAYFSPKIEEMLRYAAQKANANELLQGFELLKTTTLSAPNAGDLNGYVIDDFVVQSVQYAVNGQVALTQNNENLSDFTGLVICTENENQPIQLFIHDSKVYIPAHFMDGSHILRGQKILVKQ